MRRISHSFTVVAAIVALASLAVACSSTDGSATGGAASDAGGDTSLPGNDQTPDDTPDSAPPESPDASTSLGIGATARTTASGGLNLRTGAGTSNAIVTSMPCGSKVTVVGGPVTGWWNVTFGTQTGWASGLYLVPDASFNPSVCGGDASTASDAGAATPDVAAIFARAKLAVGYSYYWGHGSWRDDGTNLGSCSGSCGNCTHTGQYGADCSGFVAKVWQVPSASPITTDLHPYATVNFYNERTHWTEVPRAQMKPADALVYNANGAGHIMLFESGSDPWGNIWTYEARGCSTGVVHNLRVAASTFIAIRREGL